MRRHPPYDPPEYLDWVADPELVAEFARRPVRDPELQRVVEALTPDEHLRIYRHLLVTRLVDIQLKRWVRQGVISKAWLGTGEEAVTVGSVLALDPERDVVCPMIRNAGACVMMGMPAADIFRGYLASSDAPNGGRDLHVGDLSRGILQPISHMGTNVPVMAGVALAFRYRGEPRVALTWVGDGATRSGESHEGLNLAAVLGVPAVFVLQNNQVALGTAAARHGRGDLARLPDAYGIPSWECDGNNVLDVYACTRLATERCRRGEGPAMVVAVTFRMGGHATHDEREAREAFPPELFREWGRREPVGLYEAFLEGEGVPRSVLEEVEAGAEEMVASAAEEALLSRNDAPPPEWALYPGISEGGVLHPIHKRSRNSSQDFDTHEHT